MSQAQPVQPPCPDGCENQLPAVDFSKCSPILHKGQIQKIYATNIGQSLTDWTVLANWTARLSNDSAAVDAIRTFHVIASKPKPEQTSVDISLGRKVTSQKTHKVPFKIDETGPINYEFVRKNECNGGGQYLIWYETSDGMLSGGSAGIEASMNCDYIIPDATNTYCTIEGEFVWEADFTEERIESPLAA